MKNEIILKEKRPLDDANVALPSLKVITYIIYYYITIKLYYTKYFNILMELIEDCMQWCVELIFGEEKKV